MEIIAVIFMDFDVKRTLAERNYCKSVLKKFAEYVVEKDKYGIEFNIPLSVDGCRELINEIHVLQEKCGEEDCFIYDLIPRKQYTKKDYEQAVAYNITWGNFVYGYDGYDTEGIYWSPCCEHDAWYDGGRCGIQIGSYRMPFSHFKNKKCAITGMYDYVVNEDIKNLMKNSGALEDDFFPVMTKESEVVCWQLRPQNILYGLGETNGWKKIRGCLNCGKETYIRDRYDFYWMGPETAEQLKALNISREEFGRFFQPHIIINKEIYSMLKKVCPRLFYEPIFLKE